jgi:hypothetical protein
MSSRSLLLLTAAALFVGGAAWASEAGTHSVDVTLTSPTTINGTVVQPGDYVFSWMGDTNKVNVNVERDHKVVAKAQARVVERKRSSDQEEVISRTMDNGAQVLEELRLRGQDTALVFKAS